MISTRINLIILTTLFSTVCAAQEVHKDYFQISESAFAKLSEAKYCDAMHDFEIMVKHGSELTFAWDNINAARAHSMCGNVESANKFLKTAIKKGKWDDINVIFEDTLLSNLRASKYWESLRGLAVKTKEKKTKNIDIKLQNQLSEILTSDQATRIALDSLARLENEKQQIEVLLEKMIFQDSINQAFVVDYLRSNGWPKEEKVCEIGTDALFFTVQHASPEIQKELLPTILKAAKKNARLARYAPLLIDRIKVREGKPQIYGTQYFYNPETDRAEFFPIEDKKNINELRRKMGYEPIEYFAQYFEIYWDTNK
jgi:hypothetical protein